MWQLPPALDPEQQQQVQYQVGSECGSETCDFLPLLTLNKSSKYSIRLGQTEVLKRAVQYIAGSMKRLPRCLVGAVVHLEVGKQELGLWHLMRRY